MGIKNKIYAKAEKQLAKLLKPQVEKILKAAWFVYEQQIENCKKAYPFIDNEEDFIIAVKEELLYIDSSPIIDEVIDNDESL